MSDFAYFRFLSLKLLTEEEEQHKDEVISATEQVLAANGIECDEQCAKMSEEQTVKILEEVRRIRLVRKKKKRVSDEEEVDKSKQHDEKEAVYAA